MIFNRYINSKRDYLNLVFLQTGGKMKHIKNILLKDGTNVQFTFMPTIIEVLNEDNDDFNILPIKYNEKNVFHMAKFIKSNNWKNFLKYSFDDIRPFILPRYTPEMYYIDDIKTNVECMDENMIIIITGILKKYSYQYVKNIYDKNPGSTWSDKKIEKLTATAFYDLIGESFYKYTQEGELIVYGIGQLSMGSDTKMNLKILS